MGLNILYESIGAIKYPPFIHLALNTEMDMKYMDVIKGTYHTYTWYINLNTHKHLNKV